MSEVSKLNDIMKKVDTRLFNEFELYQTTLSAYVICDLMQHSKRYPKNEYTFVSAMGSWFCHRPRPGYEHRQHEVYSSIEVNIASVRKFQEIFDRYGDIAYTIFPVMKVTAKAGKIKIEKDW